MRTSRSLYLITFSLLILLSACATRSLSINSDIDVKELGICVDFNELMESDEKLLYLDTTKEFVEEFNQVRHRFKLATCNANQTYQLKILVQNTRFINPGEQALYVAFSTAGIVYPFLGGKIIFAWLGFNTSNLAISASKALASDVKPIYTQFYSSPYFLSADDVRLKHMEKYKVYLAELIQDVETRSDAGLRKSADNAEQTEVE